MATGVIGGWRERIGSVGVWASGMAVRQPGGPADVARRVEGLGLTAVWVGGGNPDAAALAERRAMLAATSGLVVATGIANIWAWEPAVLQAEAAAIAADFPGRFILGLGVSHAPLVRQLGRSYERPLAAMREFLDGLDQAAADSGSPARAGGSPARAGGSPARAGGSPARGGAAGTAGPLRVLAALGPRMLRLARDRSAGAHPYLVVPAHTALARRELGPAPLLAPEQAVVVSPDAGLARQVARDYLATYLGLPNYAASLRRLGFGDADLAGGGSDRLIDAVVPWGDPVTVAARVGEHLAAGADHVAVQPLGEGGALDLAGLGNVAAALRSG